ncbi:glutaredoxin family protein [Dokdonella sp.]|uniref:glutaredoxin family protein n=1 Tax=Dokdonella sp. TaxID=2291710 RepID=UPI003C3F3417
MLQRMLLSLAILAGAWVFNSTILPSVAIASEAAKPALDIVMYTTETCGYCIRARAWLTEQNLTWDERDIESSEAVRAEWKALGGVGTPLIMVNGKGFTGFSPNELAAEIAKYR